MAAKVYLGLGSNMGDRLQNIKQAVKMISGFATIEKLSSIYETEPVGFKEQPDFFNAACRISTELSPHDLLNNLKKIEAASGRKTSFPNAPRPIDIDILFYDNEIITTADLIIPHPPVPDRAFVLVPLAEIEPDLVHPQSRKTVRELLGELGNISGIRKVFNAEKIRD